MNAHAAIDDVDLLAHGDAQGDARVLLVEEVMLGAGAAEDAVEGFAGRVGPDHTHRLDLAQRGLGELDLDSGRRRVGREHDGEPTAGDVEADARRRRLAVGGGGGVARLEVVERWPAAISSPASEPAFHDDAGSHR